MYPSFLDTDMSARAVGRMKMFYKDLIKMFGSHGMDFDFDICRRNIVLSRAQERFFADEILLKYPDTLCDGRVGEPDIAIPCLCAEIECKITSPSPAGSINFRTDYTTLSIKGKLDYLYVVADKSFENFAVLYFSDLTISDFRSPSKSSRDKSVMIKHRCMDRCTVIMGSVESVNKREIRKIQSDIVDISLKHISKVASFEKRILSAIPGTKMISSLTRSLDNELANFKKRISKLNIRMTKWRQKEEMYSIKMVPLPQP